MGDTMTSPKPNISEWLRGDTASKDLTSSEMPNIPDWFRGKRVLVTGGTGFMGKVLVEKLLRSCPEIDTVYLLLRIKKGISPASRVKTITDQALFDTLRNESPSSFNKLVAVAGDIKAIGLGLQPEDRAMLQDHVAVVFHTAASVRFDDPIRDAILINVRGTRELVDLALGMKNLQVLMHVSTTFCTCDQFEVFEKVYASSGDWRAMIKMAEDLTNDLTLRCLTPKILGMHPNTYTYAKALAEQLIQDYKEQIPVVIVRPSVVVSSAEEPFPGWVDNYNGPVGLFFGGGVGILRSVHANPDIVNDCVPVDIAIRSMIYLAWHRHFISATNSLPVYNCCSMVSPKVFSDVIEIVRKCIDKTPSVQTLWFPSLTLTYNKYSHFLKIIFYHMLPAMIIDGVLIARGREPTLTKLQRRIYNATTATSRFIMRDYCFNNTQYMRAQDAMLPEDVESFRYKVVENNVEFLHQCVLGCRLHLLKEGPDNLPQALRKYNRLYWMDRIVKTGIKMAAAWTIVTMSLPYYHNTLLPNLQHLLD